MGTLAVASIDLYRRYVSPYKGFKCAHNALHRRGSCSAFGRLVFARKAFLDAVALMRRRFAQCKAAAMVLHAAPLRAEAETEEDRAKRRTRDWPCDCGVPVPNISSGSTATEACTSVDFCACSI